MNSSIFYCQHDALGNRSSKRHFSYFFHPIEPESSANNRIPPATLIWTWRSFWSTDAMHVPLKLTNSDGNHQEWGTIPNEINLPLLGHNLKWNNKGQPTMTPDGAQPQIQSHQQPTAAVTVTRIAPSRGHYRTNRGRRLIPKPDRGGTFSFHFSFGAFFAGVFAWIRPPTLEVPTGEVLPVTARGVAWQFAGKTFSWYNKLVLVLYPDFCPLGTCTVAWSTPPWSIWTDSRRRRVVGRWWQWKLLHWLSLMFRWLFKFEAFRCASNEEH